MKYDYIIGIDPSGVKQESLKNGKGWTAASKRTGICVLRNTGNISKIETVSFWEAVETLDINRYNGFGILIVIENPDGGQMFDRGIKGGKLIGQATRLGKNQMVSNLLASKAKYLGFDVLELTPDQKGSKISERYFRADTGYKGKVTEHAIDAHYLARIGYNRMRRELQTIK